MTLFKFKGTVLKIPRLSSFLAEQRFYMEEDRKGRGREKSPLSLCLSNTVVPVANELNIKTVTSMLVTDVGDQMCC